MIRLMEECHKYYKKIYAEARKKYDKKYGINESDIPLIEDLIGLSLDSQSEIDFFVATE